MKWFPLHCPSCLEWVLNDVTLDALDDEALQKTVETFHALDHPEIFFWTAPPRREEL